MALIETNTVIPTHIDIMLKGDIEIPAGKIFKIETMPDGEEIYARVVPEGKNWIVNFNMIIQEVSV